MASAKRCTDSVPPTPITPHAPRELFVSTEPVSHFSDSDDSDEETSTPKPKSKSRPKRKYTHQAQLLAAAERKSKTRFFLKGEFPHIRHLKTKLYPLVSVATNEEHPEFPRTLLHYHLLTEAQLDSLARFYHQDMIQQHSASYPCPIATRWVNHPDATHADKKRRFGRFIGLRQCESPVRPTFERSSIPWERDTIAVQPTDGSDKMEIDPEEVEMTQAQMDEIVRKELERRMAAEMERYIWSAKGFDFR